MMKNLIHPKDIYDFNKNKTENPFSAPIHEKPNINFDKAQADQTLAGKNLTLYKHTTMVVPALIVFSFYYIAFLYKNFNNYAYYQLAVHWLINKMGNS